MARPDTSIDPRIMDSAREEFRTLGFERASLKSICQRAGVTTGALYKRYAGKEELFRAVVAIRVRSLNLLPAGVSSHSVFCSPNTVTQLSKLLSPGSFKKSYSKKRIIVCNSVTELLSGVP